MGWLLRVNKKLLRGHEHYAVLQKFANNGEEVLRAEDFLDIHVGMAREGKFWEVESDLRMYGHGLEQPSDGPYEERLDHIFFTPQRLQLDWVQEPLTNEQR